MSIDYYKFLERPAREFYHMVRFHSWEADSQNEYSRIMGRKANSK